MTISVAMATYNGARYLSEQLESFAAQTRLPDELVVCDDGSTDGTPALVDAFAARAPFSVRLHRNGVNLGYNRNFAQAIGLCAGDTIFVSDQDDVWYPHKIATMAALMDRHPDAMVATCDQDIADADGRATGSTVLGNIRNLRFSDAMFEPGCCTALRREWLGVIAPFPGDIVPYDHWLTVFAVLLGRRRLHDAPLQMYRRHASNTSGSVFAVENASAMTLVAASRSIDIRPEYRDRIAGNEVIADRLRARRDVVRTWGMADRLDDALAALDAESAAYARRLAALNSSRLARLPTVARMLTDGTYKRFSGIKSAFKDLLT